MSGPQISQQLHYETNNVTSAYFLLIAYSTIKFYVSISVHCLFYFILFSFTLTRPRYDNIVLVAIVSKQKIVVYSVSRRANWKIYLLKISCQIEHYHWGKISFYELFLYSILNFFLLLLLSLHFLTLALTTQLGFERRSKADTKIQKYFLIYLLKSGTIFRKFHSKNYIVILAK